MERNIYELSRIPGILDNTNNAFNIRVIAKLSSGSTLKTPVLDFINKLKKSSKTEYNKLILSLRKVSAEGRKCNKKRLVSDDDGRDIFEIRTPMHTGARLFCFPDKDGKLLICTNHYKKSKGSIKVQKREFDKCFIIKKGYYKEKYNLKILK